MTTPIRLTRMLTLETRRTTPDMAGGFEVIWEPLGRLWADVRVRSGGAFLADGQVGSRVIYKIIVRAAPVDAPSRPKPNQRLREGTRIFDILSVAENDAHGWYLEVVAEEGRVR